MKYEDKVNPKVNRLFWAMYGAYHSIRTLSHAYQDYIMHLQPVRISYTVINSKPAMSAILDGKTFSQPRSLFLPPDYTSSVVSL